MDYARVTLLLKHPAAKLLRADQAAFALAFLHTAFKETGQAAVTEELLRTRLERWLDERRAAEVLSGSVARGSISTNGARRIVRACARCMAAHSSQRSS